MHYQVRAPLPQLAAVVDCVWTLTGDPAGAGAGEPVLPDGCPELIVQFGDVFERVDRAGTASRQAAALFAGQLTEALTLRPRGAVATLGVRFTPSGAAAVLRMPQQPLIATTFGLDVVDPALWRAVTRIRDAAASLDDAVDQLQAYLATRVDAGWVDPRVTEAARVIRERRGQVSIDRIAARVGVTRRHLERRFDVLVGISPKRLARITRFQHALRVLARRAAGGAATALECGYADQSHFIRDFTALAGCSPGTHLLRQAELTGFFSTVSEAVAPCRVSLPAPSAKP